MELVSNKDDVDQQRAMAQFLGSKGFRVFPLFTPVKNELGEIICSCGETDCRSIGKHPIITGWQNRATNKDEEIEEFWTQYPEANIGIVTGDNLVVVDVDPRNGGFETLESLFEGYGPFPRTVTVSTGGGGKHYYFLCNTEEIRCKNNGLGEGIDIKSSGGYVVGPGSIHASGMLYEFEDGLDPEEVDIAELPSWVIDRLTGSRKKDENGHYIYEGTRNQTLASIGGNLRNKGMELGELTATLFSINNTQCRPPLSENEVKGIARSISRYPSNVVAFPRITTYEAEKREHFAYSDYGNAERLVKYHGADIRFSPERNKWFYYDGARWKEDKNGVITLYAKETVRSISEEAIIPGLSDKERESIKAFALKSESSSKIKSMIELAKTESGIPIELKSFDSDKWLFNVANGTIDLRTGKLLPHKKEDLISKVADIDYNKDAECPMFLKFLDRIFNHDMALITFIQQLVGYSMTGFINEQVLAIFYGTGANGKSTLLNILRALFGEYGKTASANTFLCKKFDTISNDLAGLAGARLVTISEIERNKDLSESLVKSATGEDPLTVRFLYENEFTYTPTYQIIMATNELPKINGTDYAIWRRLKRIPFDIQIPKEEQDRQLAEKLQSELPGILNWAIDGCLQWQNNGGLASPTVVEEATEEYKTDMNALQQFLNDECEAGSDTDFCHARDLFDRYKLWASENNESAVNVREFKREMENNGYKQVKKSSGNVWNSLKLKDRSTEIMDRINMESETASAERVNDIHSPRTAKASKELSQFF